MREGGVNITIRLEREGLAANGVNLDRATGSLMLDLDHLLVSPDVPGGSAALCDSLVAHLRGAVREWEASVRAEPALVRIERALAKEDGNGSE